MSAKNPEARATRTTWTRTASARWRTPAPPLRSLLALLVVAALSGLAAVAGADPLHGHRGPLGAFGRHHGPMGPLGMRFLAAAERLDLSDAQRTQLKQIRRKAPREVMPKVQSLMEARMELQDLLAEDKTDKTGLRRAHQKVLDAQAALHSAMFNLRMEVRDVLTPEQRSELRQGMRRRGGERPGPGPRGGFEPDWDPDEEQEF